MSNMAHDSESARIRLFSGEFEEKARQEVEKRLRLGDEVTVLVFGRDVGDLASSLAESGARVVVDADNGNLPAHAGLRTLQFSLAALPDAGALPEAPFDVIFGQLALHALPYGEAHKALSRVMQMLKIGGKLYLSAYGLHSTLGDHYPDSGKLVEQRFAELPAALADLYGLSGPVCLYSERNLFTLLFEIGAPVLQSSTGALGNVQAVAVRI